MPAGHKRSSVQPVVTRSTPSAAADDDPAAATENGVLAITQRKRPPGWRREVFEKRRVQMNSLNRASRRSWRPLSRSVTSPIFRACLSQSANVALPASIFAPMPESQLR